MITITESIEIEAKPKDVTNWFLWLLEKNNYTKMHKAHISLKFGTDLPVREGSIIRLKEKLGNFVLDGNMKVTEIIPDKRTTYKFLFPYSLLNLSGGFKVKKIKGGARFSDTMHYGWDFPILGYLFDRVIDFFMSREIIQQHVREELPNVRRMIESRKH